MMRSLLGHQQQQQRWRGPLATALRRPKRTPCVCRLQHLLVGIIGCALLLLSMTTTLVWRQQHEQQKDATHFVASNKMVNLTGLEGYQLAERFLPVQHTRPVEDVYITLWYHHARDWLQFDSQKTRTFLQQAQDAGFTSVMTDFPWEMTEHDVQGEYDIDSHGKDWIESVCTLNMGLHVVLQTRSMPQWLRALERQQPNGTIYHEISKAVVGGKVQIFPGETPAIAHPFVQQAIQKFMTITTQKLTQKYGKCIMTVSPTMNNEFETRYVQQQDAMGDMSDNVLPHWHEWQRQRRVFDPPKGFPRPPSKFPQVQAHTQKHTWEFIGFREAFLAQQYHTLCDSMVQANRQQGGIATCLLHIGEIFATTDLLNANLFFQLVQSPHVGHVVMDSNMALHGVPASPSVVGLLISTAKRYNKHVHYEAATERIMHCDEQGKLVDDPSQIQWDTASALLLQKGVQYALDAGVDSIGVTNLCEPPVAGELFRHVAGLSARRSQQQDHRRQPGQHGLQTAPAFTPTAIIFVPYRGFYAFKSALTGLTWGKCVLPATTCWHPSFAKGEGIPRFGLGNTFKLKDANECPVDHLQHGLIRLWDELRTRHAHVAVIGDPVMLDPALLSRARERYWVSFPKIMDRKSKWSWFGWGGLGKWLFFEGEATRREFERKTRGYSFTEYKISQKLLHPTCNK